MHKKAENFRQRAREAYGGKIRRSMEEKGGKGVKEVVARIDNRQAQPIAFLERDREGPQGQEAGTITTDPKEIDGIVKRAWKKIYAGTKDDTKKATEEFLEKYKAYLYRAEEYIIHAITMEDVREACREAGKTAGGLDGWDPADMSLLSDTVYGHIAALMNLIEAGAPWPAPMTTARAAFFRSTLLET